MLNDFMVKLKKRRLPSDVTFVTVYGICAGHFLYVITCIKVFMCFIYVCFVIYC